MNYAPRIPSTLRICSRACGAAPQVESAAPPAGGPAAQANRDGGAPCLS